MQLVAALTETVAEAPMSKPAQEVAVAEPEPAAERQETLPQGDYVVAVK